MCWEFTSMFRYSVNAKRTRLTPHSLYLGPLKEVWEDLSGRNPNLRCLFLLATSFGDKSHHSKCVTEVTELLQLFITGDLQNDATLLQYTLKPLKTWMCRDTWTRSHLCRNKRRGGLNYTGAAFHRNKALEQLCWSLSTLHWHLKRFKQMSMSVTWLAVLLGM